MKQTPNFMVKPAFWTLNMFKTALSGATKIPFPVAFPAAARYAKMRNLRGGSHHNATDDHQQTEPGTWKFIGISSY